MNGERGTARGGATALLSAALIIIGIVLVIRTANSGGSPISVGVVLGLLFVAAGAGRLWLAWRSR